jgi:hypothetical protein
VDLSTLTSSVSNIETLWLANGSAGTTLSLDALSVATLADTRNSLTVQLDSGDTLSIAGTYIETSRTTAGNGSISASYQLFDTADTSVPPTSTLNVQWLAPGAPPPGG